MSLFSLKYRFTGETRKDPCGGATLRRIERISDGLLGGWIEHEGNLSQAGRCFVYDNAMVSGNGRVAIHAEVRESAWVRDYAFVEGKSKVRGNCHVRGHSHVEGDAVVEGHATLKDRAYLCSQAIVKGNAVIGGNARVSGTSVVTSGVVDGQSTVDGDSEVTICFWVPLHRYGITITDSLIYINGIARSFKEWTESRDLLTSGFKFTEDQASGILIILSGYQTLIQEEKSRKSLGNSEVITLDFYDEHGRIGFFRDEKRKTVKANFEGDYFSHGICKNLVLGDKVRAELVGSPDGLRVVKIIKKEEG